MLSVLITFGFGLYFFIQLLQKSSVFVTNSTEQSPFLQIQDSNNFPFLLRLTDGENRPLESPEKIYKVYLKYWYGGSNKTLELVEQKNYDIQVEQCDLNKHFGEYRELFQNIRDINTFYCPILRKSNETIYGRYGDLYPFGYYHFYLAMCEKDSNCYDLSTIEKITSNVYLDFRSVDFTMNSLNKEAKVKTVHTSRHMLSSTVYKRIWIYLRGVKYVTDSNLFFQTEAIEMFSKHESMRYDIDHRDIIKGTIPGTFTTITVLSTGDNYIYYRHYLKIQEYLASIGGIINFIRIVALVFNYIFSTNSYYHKLINDMNIVQLFDKETIVQPDKHLNLQLNHANNKIRTLFNEKKTDINESNEHINNQQIKDQSHFRLLNKMSKWQYRMIPLRLFNKKDSEMFQKLLDRIDNYLNIITVLTKLEESYLISKDLFSDGKNEKTSFDKKLKLIQSNKLLSKDPYSNKANFGSVLVRNNLNKKATMN